MGEALHQVDNGARFCGGELVEELVDDAHDGGFERGDPRRGEGSGDELAQSAVILPVDGEHVPCEGGPGEPFVDDLRVLVEGGEEVLREAACRLAPGGRRRDR